MHEYLSYLTLACLVALVAGLLCEVLRIARRNRQLQDAFTLPNENAVAATLSALLTSGSDGGWIIISESPGRRFVQFRKQCDADGRGRLETVFPRAEWSEDYYESVRYLLQELGLVVERVALREPNAPIEYLRADIGRDLHVGATFVMRVFREVFNSVPDRFHLETDRIG